MRNEGFLKESLCHLCDALNASEDLPFLNHYQMVFLSQMMPEMSCQKCLAKQRSTVGVDNDQIMILLENNQRYTQVSSVENHMHQLWLC